MINHALRVAIGTVVFAWTTLWYVMFATGCGGSGGNYEGPKDSAGNAIPTTTQVSYNCEHDGAVYACKNGGDCGPSSTINNTVSAVSDAGITKSGKSLTEYKLSTGDTLIIAECGSTVHYSPSETVTTTNTSTDVNSHNPTTDTTTNSGNTSGGA